MDVGSQSSAPIANSSHVLVILCMRLNKPVCKRWRDLHLAEHFFARLSDTAAFSRRFAPCVAALDRHIDEAAGRIARLG